ncbi:MAG: hypothetical protein A3A51_04445 [Candidatus Levybacteria bacterium RIFCSPLOWO2_01_FULL_39_10]|nr:MAG: hypothetical protein A3A51_04445 [Candidatus Levybacteria bacterium RIFCSPLOWO2_01_FULL_39_10]
MPENLLSDKNLKPLNTYDHSVSEGSVPPLTKDQIDRLGYFKAEDNSVPEGPNPAKPLIPKITPRSDVSSMDINQRTAPGGDINKLLNWILDKTGRSDQITPQREDPDKTT